METCFFFFFPPAAGVLFQVKALLLDSYAERWEGGQPKKKVRLTFHIGTHVHFSGLIRHKNALLVAQM